MFYTLLNLSPLWKDSSENKRRSRIMILGTSFYILVYSYLQSSMAPTEGYALMLKNYIKYIIGLDVLFIAGLQMKNAYSQPQLNPQMQNLQMQYPQDDASMQQQYQPILPLQMQPHIQQLQQQNQPMPPLPMAQPQMPQPEMPRPQKTMPPPPMPKPPTQQMQPPIPQPLIPQPVQQSQPSPPIREEHVPPEPEIDIPMYNNKST